MPPSAQIGSGNASPEYDADSVSSRSPRSTKTSRNEPIVQLAELLEACAQPSPAVTGAPLSLMVTASRVTLTTTWLRSPGLALKLTSPPSAPGVAVTVPA